jgi:spermidine synthase
MLAVPTWHVGPEPARHLGLIVRNAERVRCRVSGSQPTRLVLEQTVMSTPHRTQWRWMSLFSGVGALALGTQVYLLREYMVALSGDEAAVGLGLCAWLVGIAIGAALARPWGVKRSAAIVAAAIALLAAGGFLEMLLARLGRRLLDVPAGELLPLGPALVLALLVFVVPGALVGIAFVAMAAAASADESTTSATIGRLYVFESVGSLVAGIVVSLVLLPMARPCVGLLILQTFALAAVLPAAWARLIAGRIGLAALASIALLCVMTPLAGRLETATQRARFATLAQGATLLDWVDSPYEHLAIGSREVLNLYAGGVYVKSYPDALDDESRAHQLMLLNARPSRVLALGGVEAGLLRFCLMHPVQRLDLVVIDRRAFELVARHLDAPDRAALADPRVHVHFQDPRRYLANSADPYDLILLLERDPATLYLTRETTVQFAKLVSTHLAPGGSYVTRFAAGPTLQAGNTGRLGASLYRTLRDGFVEVRAAPGPVGLFVAGNSSDAVTLDPLRLAERWRERKLQSDVFVPELLPDLYPAERVATLESELKRAAQRVAPSRDNRPASFLYALSLRQQMAQSTWSRALGWGIHHPRRLQAAAIAPSSLLLLWLLLQRFSNRSRGFAEPSMLVVMHATAVTGACGMAFSLLLFFSFQTRVGALYSEIGLLSALFMGGLAAGGALAVRRLSLAAAQAVSLGAGVVLALSFALMDRHSVSSGWVTLVHGLLLVFSGAATGAVFPAAVNALIKANHSAQSAASAPEFSDHFGAAVAAVFASIMFVPILGLTQAALTLCALQALTLVSIGLVTRGKGAVCH